MCALPPDADFAPPGTGPTAMGAHGDSPHERLLALGCDALTTRDLLELLLASPRRTAPAATQAARLLGEEVLGTTGGLRRLARLSVRELKGRYGLGHVAALRVSAALALGRRLSGERLPRGRLLRASAEIFDHFHERLRGLRKERFLTVLLDGKNRVIREDLVSEGILTASLVHPREVFAPAIRESAGGLVLVHNHPSGDPEPSPEDLEVTRRLCAVGELVGIRVLDHVVIGDGCYVSFLERGLLPA